MRGDGVAWTRRAVSVLEGRRTRAAQALAAVAGLSPGRLMHAFTESVGIPLDVVVRIFTEQWVKFPRFVASGGFARAWKQR